MEDLLKKLGEVQYELKAPKDKTNTFGKYEYRSAEGILEAVKPLLKKHGLTQTITDEVRLLGERYYLVSKVTIYSGEASHSVEGWARESLDKKGMDESQITGAASSYARKYALNGMYAIDDTKDADTDEYRKETETPKASPTRRPTDAQLQLIKELGAKLGKDEEWLGVVYDKIHSSADASEVIKELKKQTEKQR